MPISGSNVIDGIPYINGKPAIWDDNPPLLDCLSQWRCPECNSALSAEGLICLNACHLSAASYRCFQSILGHVRLYREMRMRSLPHDKG